MPAADQSLESPLQPEDSAFIVRSRPGSAEACTIIISALRKTTYSADFYAFRLILDYARSLLARPAFERLMKKIRTPEAEGQMTVISILFDIMHSGKFTKRSLELSFGEIEPSEASALVARAQAEYDVQRTAHNTALLECLKFLAKEDFPFTLEEQASMKKLFDTDLKTLSESPMKAPTANNVLVSCYRAVKYGDDFWFRVVIDSIKELPACRGNGFVSKLYEVLHSTAVTPTIMQLILTSKKPKDVAPAFCKKPVCELKDLVLLNTQSIQADGAAAEHNDRLLHVLNLILSEGVALTPSEQQQALQAFGKSFFTLAKQYGIDVQLPKALPKPVELAPVSVIDLFEQTLGVRLDVPEKPGATASVFCSASSPSTPGRRTPSPTRTKPVVRKRTNRKRKADVIDENSRALTPPHSSEEGAPTNRSGHATPAISPFGLSSDDGRTTPEIRAPFSESTPNSPKKHRSGQGEMKAKPRGLPVSDACSPFRDAHGRDQMERFLEDPTKFPAW